MDTKLKKSKRVLYGLMSILCVGSFLSLPALLTGLYIIVDLQKKLRDGLPSWATESALLFALIGAALVCLGTLIYLIAEAGERDAEGKLCLRRIDRIFTEIIAFLMGMLFLCGGVFVQLSYGGVRLWMLGSSGSEWIYLAIPNGGGISAWETIPMDLLSLEGMIGAALLIGIPAAGLGLTLLLSLVRKLKAGTFFRDSLIGRLVLWLYRAVLTVYNSGSTQRKIFLLALGVCLLAAVPFMAPFVLLAILILSARWIRKYEVVRRGINEARQGNFHFRIPVEPSAAGELDWMARSINEIADASRAAVEKEVRNQRLKTELISNVSHDLKTPLTSIVAYVELLKKEGLTSPDASKYLEILDQKITRLKQLTEDLFEAAKASSGDMPVRLEQIEVGSLIRQTLGEMSSRLEEAQLQIIFNASEEKYYALADGQLMWRVLENLLSNAVKYALPGSRVYLDLSIRTNQNKERPMVMLEMKNISRDPLNISPDELMERFSRGEESRTSEGSGLGLAITKDLMKLQNGWFDIRIDGDLFKAVVLIPAGGSPERSAGGGNEKAQASSDGQSSDATVKKTDGVPAEPPAEGSTTV